METIPAYPPPPPPQRSRNGLWIGLAIGAVILCLCCIVIIAGVYFFRTNIPILSNFLPSPTSSGLLYNNPSIGISLTYPETWQYSETGDGSYGYQIIFASTADILNNSSSTPQSGAALAIIAPVMATSDLTFTVDASSMGQVVDYIATVYFTNISQGQNLRTYTLDRYPAASGVYSMADETGGFSAAYITAVLRNNEIIMFFGVCPQTEWSQFQPTFNSIIDSASFITP
jgi:hypothetical protein